MNYKSTVRLNKYRAESNVKAFADIEIENTFVVRGFTVMNGRNGLFVNMPQTQIVNRNGQKEWIDSAFPLSKEERDIIAKNILSGYEKEIMKAKEMAQSNEYQTVNNAPPQDNLPNFEELEV